MAGFKRAFVLVAMVAVSAFADAPRCVEAPDPEDAGVQVLRCEGGLVIFAETRAIRSSAARMSAHPHAMQLDDGALLIVTPASAAPFAALTRDAVISGEGEWIVLAEDGRTLVDSISGRVVLRRRVDDAETVFDGGDAGAPWEEGRIGGLRAAWRRWRTGR